MKSSLIKFIRLIRSKAKRILIKLMLLILRPVESQSEFEGQLKSIIILAQEKIGDAILLTPLFKNLRRVFPEIEIHVVALSPVYPFFENDPNVDVVYKVKQNYLAYFQSLRKKKFDLLFSTKDHPSFTFLYQSRIIPAKYRIGIFHPYHRGFFNYLIQLDFHQHIIEKNLAILEFLNIPLTDEDRRPYLPENNIPNEIRSFSSKISNLNCIGINLSAGEKDREWSFEKWAAFLKEIDFKVIIFATQDRNDDKQKLENMFGHVVQSPITKTIFEVGHILQHLKLLISPDTALIHLASCFKIDVVGLYRSKVIHLTRFYPYLVNNQVLISPTSRIEDIPMREVIDAVNVMVSKQNNSSVFSNT